MNDLKPCPFCGDEPAKTFSSDCSSFYIQCMNEDCAIQPGVDTRDDEHAIAIWNKRAAPEERAQDPGTEKILRTLLDRAYKMMLQAGYRVMEHDPDQNDPIGAWMSDARVVLYGNGQQPDLARLK